MTTFTNTITKVGTLCLLGSTMMSAANAHTQQIGDGNLSTSPKQGYVYSCQTSFNPNAPGAQASGDWINEAKNTWDPDIKPIIDGSVMWPSEIFISLEGDQRVITGNGLPDHATGTFPVSPSDDAYQYDRNPNSIQAQEILLKLDANPELATTPSCVPMGMIGFATSGAAIFNALDARGNDAPAYEIQDACNGHPERQGQYHYHDYSDCLVDTKSGPNGHSDLVGYALDGFGLFGKFEATNVEVHSDDLDACHGHTSTIEWDGELKDMYHYHFSADYPYTLGCFMGDVSTQVSSTSSNDGGERTIEHTSQRPNNERQASVDQGPRNGQAGPNSRGGQILEKVAKTLGVSVNQLKELAGSPPPNIKNIAQNLGISENDVRSAFRNAR